METRLQKFWAAVSDRYELVRELGSGARAIVFLARDLKHNRRVAVKVLHPEFAASIGADRFLREIGFAAGMTHPHILPLYDSGDASGLLFYVMPFVEGETLRDHLDAHGPLPISEALTYARQISDALGYAHRQGVIHRDIKPENVLLEEGKAVVADFGIATTTAPELMDRLTREGMAVGTPQYMSPEQAAGEVEVDGRSDMYSLGCVLYEMIVGSPPFAGRNAAETIAQHLSRHPEAPLELRRDVPVWLNRVILKTLAKHPEERFESADALSEELSAHFSSDFDQVTDPWIRWVYRIHRRRWVYLSGVVFLVAFGLWRSWGPTDSDIAPPTIPDPSRMAVLCFEDLTPDGSLAYVARGITTGLIASLNTSDVLEVISHDAVRPFCGPVPRLDSIRESFGVGLIVSGDVQRSGEVLRTRIQLTDPVDGSQIDQGQVRLPMAEIFSLEEEVVGEAARLIRPWIGREVALRERRSGTQDGEAWSLVQRADLLREEARNAGVFAEGGSSETVIQLLLTADSLVEAALHRDSDWIEARLDRGWVALELADRVFPTDTAAHAQLLSRAEEDAERVLSSNPDHAGALELKGQMLMDRATDNTAYSDSTRWEAAAAAFRAAVTADPRRASAWARLVPALILLGRTQEAEEAAHRALEEDAYLAEGQGITYGLFVANLDLGRESRAEEWCAEGVQRYPEVPSFMQCRLRLLAHADSTPPDTALARAYYSRVQEKLGGEDSEQKPYFVVDNRLQLAATFARAGAREEARRQIEAVRSFAARLGLDSRYEFEMAWVMIVLGDRPGALQSIRTLLEASPEYRPLVAGDRQFRSLSDDPEFRRLVGGTPDR